MPFSRPLKSPLLILIWIVFCCSYGILWLRRYYLDKKDSFERFMVGDLTSNGFTLLSSRFIKNKTPIATQGYKSALHPASGGLTMATFHGYKVFRTVIIKNQLDQQFEVLAAIEFDDRSLLRKFKSVTWTPELKTVLETKED